MANLLSTSFYHIFEDQQCASDNLHLR